MRKESSFKCSNFVRFLNYNHSLLNLWLKTNLLNRLSSFICSTIKINVYLNYFFYFFPTSVLIINDLLNFSLENNPNFLIFLIKLLITNNNFSLTLTIIFKLLCYRSNQFNNGWISDFINKPSNFWKKSLYNQRAFCDIVMIKPPNLLNLINWVNLLLIVPLAKFIPPNDFLFFSYFNPFQCNLFYNINKKKDFEILGRINISKAIYLYILFNYYSKKGICFINI